jgi:MSHA pilin protein MshA
LIFLNNLCSIISKPTRVIFCVFLGILKEPFSAADNINQKVLNHVIFRPGIIGLKLKRYFMKQQSGFTLIELIIVIVILGILSITAVPRFINIQSEASAAALEGLKGALKSALTLTYSKAVIDGVAGVAWLDDDEPNNNLGYALIYGYPAATDDALGQSAGLSMEDWIFTDGDDSDTYITIAGQGDGSPTGECQVIYKQADASSRPIVTAITTGC